MRGKSVIAVLLALGLAAASTATVMAQGLPSIRAQQQQKEQTEQQPNAFAPAPDAVRAPRSEASPLGDLGAPDDLPDDLPDLPASAFTDPDPTPPASPLVATTPPPNVEELIQNPMLDPVKNLRGVPDVETKALFIRLGGRQEMVVIVRNFLEGMLEDEQLAPYFVDINRYWLEAQMFDHMCELTGGFCIYAGQTMDESHRGLNIPIDHFVLTGKHLAEALDRSYIPEKEKQELLALVSGMVGDFVKN